MSHIVVLNLNLNMKIHYIDLDFWDKYKTIYAYEYLNCIDPLDGLENELNLPTLEYYLNSNCLDELIFVGSSEFEGYLNVTPEELYQMGYNCNDNTFGKARLPKGSNIQTVDDDYLQSDEFLDKRKFKNANEEAEGYYNVVMSFFSRYSELDLIGIYIVENGEITGKNSSFTDYANEYGNIDDTINGKIYIKMGDSEDNDCMVQFTEDGKLVGQYPEPPTSIEDAKKITFGE